MDTTHTLPSDSQKLIVFLAEDDEDDASLFEETLVNFLPEVDITILENGELMMHHLHRTTEIPDIIFLDINMPKKSGIDCLREIKNNEEFTTVKTVILSTTSDEKQIKKCYELGADHFITKPSSIQTFETLMRQCLEFLNVL